MGEKVTKKKAGLMIVYASFIVIICLLWFWWFFLEKYADTANYENRQLNEPPRLTLDTYKQFPNLYERYFNDSLPFRNSFITLNNSIDYFLFNKASNDDVAIGLDNWLFYCNVDDGDPIACYQGNNLLSEEQLTSLAENCIRQRDFLKAQGIEFVILIVPNKERIYYEKMPQRYGPPAEQYRVLQIVNYLKANTDLRVIYAYDELMSAKSALQENIYYKTDTHWNEIGAYVGSRALLHELGIEIPDLVSDQIKITLSGEYGGDLAGFLNLKSKLQSFDQWYTIEGYDTHQVVCLGEDHEGAFLYSAHGADPRKLYVVRDSFAIGMLPYLSSQFNESCFRHRRSYSYEDFVSHQPDIFVYETVERYAGYLSDFSVQ